MSNTTTIEVMWRPGCPYCSSLRRGLRRAKIETTEHNIWSSKDASARVRKATGGDETVPTVFVGGRALVNPSVRQVTDAIKAAGLAGPDEPKAATGDRPSSSWMRRARSRVARWMGAETDTTSTDAEVSPP
ncbi:hypothetical protein GCM10027020_05860 [Nocardioides salsibiostraticola]